MPTPSPLNPKAALLSLRIIWVALLMGQLGFLGYVMIQNAQSQREPRVQAVFVAVSTVMLLISVPIGFIVRSIVFKKASTNGVVNFAAYQRGNIIFWAMCEGPAFFAIIVIQMTGLLWPCILNLLAAMACQVLTFPTGKPLKAPDETFKIE
jgi:hypothetical protein